MTILSGCLRQATLWLALPRMWSVACQQEYDRAMHNEYNDYLKQYSLVSLDLPAPVLDLAYPYQEKLR